MINHCWRKPSTTVARTCDARQWKYSDNSPNRSSGREWLLGFGNGCGWNGNSFGPRSSSSRLRKSIQRRGETASKTGRIPHTDYRAEYVRQAISSAPLSLWNNMIGGPGKALGMSVDEGWEPILHDAWSTAAVAENNTEWALELIRMRGTATDRRVLPLVPAKALADLLRSGNGDANVLHPGRAAIYDALRGPWPEDITRAVVAQWERVAARRADGGAKAGEFSRYKYVASLRLAETRFPYSAVTLLERAAERARDPDWRQTFARTASAITHRKTLLEELT